MLELRDAAVADVITATAARGARVVVERGSSVLAFTWRDSRCMQVAVVVAGVAADQAAGYLGFCLALCFKHCFTAGARDDWRFAAIVSQVSVRVRLYQAVIRGRGRLYAAARAT